MLLGIINEVERRDGSGKLGRLIMEVPNEYNIYRQGLSRVYRNTQSTVILA